MSEAPRPRALYVLFNYPMLSETYIQVELAQVARAFDVFVVSGRPSEVMNDDAYPFVVEGDPNLPSNAIAGGEDEDRDGRR